MISLTEQVTRLNEQHAHVDLGEFCYLTMIEHSRRKGQSLNLPLNHRIPRHRGAISFSFRGGGIFMKFHSITSFVLIQLWYSFFANGRR